MQAVRNAPDHLETHENSQNKHDKVLHEARGCNKPNTEQKHAPTASKRHLVLGLLLERGHFCGAFFLWRQLLGTSSLGLAAIAATFGGGGGKVISPFSWVTVAPRMTSSSIL